MSEGELWDRLREHDLELGTHKADLAGLKAWEKAQNGTLLRLESAVNTNMSDLLTKMDRLTTSIADLQTSQTAQKIVLDALVIKVDKACVDSGAVESRLKAYLDNEMKKAKEAWFYSFAERGIGKLVAIAGGIVLLSSLIGAIYALSRWITGGGI